MTLRENAEPTGSILKAEDAGSDSQPLNFDTFMPSHDPTLGVPAPPQPGVQDPRSSTATQDEAFNNAMGAMYWAGYWTAVYHVRIIGPPRMSADPFPVPTRRK